MARGRKPIEVDPAELSQEITKLESTQPDGVYPNRSQLWVALEATEWAKSRNPRPLTGQVAASIARKVGLTIKTPIGQRGRLPGAPPVPKGERKRKISLDVIGQLKRVVPSKYHKVVARVAAGSMKAAVKLKCLDCTNYQPIEIRECVVKDCSLWCFRPFRGRKNADVTGTSV